MKYFICGDIHGEFKALIKCLEESGFDTNNENHTFISLGDNFDRGSLNKAVYNYLNKLPRKILLKGNHELILRDILTRGYLTYSDMQNGCISTIASFSRLPKSQVQFDPEAIIKAGGGGKLERWIDNLPWYYETEHYIFVHGWVPFSYYSHKNLAECSEEDWIRAAWCHTEEEIMAHKEYVRDYGSLKKTIVMGHWHTWRLRNLFDNKNTLDYDIWRDDQYKVIALDACSNRSKKVNILIVDD